MLTAAKLIDDLGGPSVLAGKLDLPPLTVRMWKHRNRIPRTAWPEVQKAFPMIGLDVLLSTEHMERRVG